MSFLAPLYALAALAIGLPILLHLIRRQPRGEMVFSSLMFLTPSPPRLAKRSRLENLLLLLLRALAILLLAIAFARPFLRSADETAIAAPGRNTLILIDRSASMHRDDLWQQTATQLEEVLAAADDGDRLSLALFDSQMEVLFDGNVLNAQKTVEQAESVRTLFAKQSPGWNRTDLGRSLIEAVERIQTSEEDPDQAATQKSQIVLITDLQEGASLEKLQAFQWPQSVWLEVRQVGHAQPSNAYLTLLLRDESAPDNTAGLPIRIVNNADSSVSDFDLRYLQANGSPSDSEKQSLHVPPGASRVIELEPPKDRESVHQVVLSGDHQAFDNSVWIHTTEPMPRRLLYLGDAPDAPRTSLLFYLERSTFNTPWQTVSVEHHPATEPLPAPDPTECPLIVLGKPLVERVGELRDYLKSGGNVLAVLSEPVGEKTVDEQNAWQSVLKALAEDASLTIEEAKVADYRMFGLIDFRHPLFLPFADPQFSDFTKIRFWAHRRIGFEPADPADQGTAENLDKFNWKVLARFDEQSPALLEQDLGSGTLWVLAAGWQPEESQLALSTKFVPLLLGMFDQTLGRPRLLNSYLVGDAIPLPENMQVAYKSDRGASIPLEAKQGQVVLEKTGVYEFIEGKKQWLAVANLPADESRTTPLTIDVLEQHGVQLGRVPNRTELVDAERQKRDVELEQTQQIWKWLLIGALGILVSETLLGRRKATLPPVAKEQ